MEETYNTISRFKDLTGSMVIIDDVVKSYYSDTLGEGKVESYEGFELGFTVTFKGGSEQFDIRAYGLAGVGYLGAAKDGKVTVAAEEPWAATASTVVMFEKDAATKAAS